MRSLHILFVGYLYIFSSFFPELVWAGGRKKPETQVFDGKKGVVVAPIPRLKIEMPDGYLHDFGADFQAHLTTQLTQSGKYIVSDPDPKNTTDDSSRMGALEYHWPGSRVPSISVNVEVQALSFETGTRGDKMFYGFNERSVRLKNEFPLRTFSTEPSWFGQAFERKGLPPFDSRSGLDLGDGFNFDFLVAWLHVKYARYHAELRLKLRLDTPLDEIPDYTWIEVQGNGFFFDVAGAYENYSLGITVARRDAMEKALMRAIAGTFGAIDRALESQPLMARIDAVLKDGTLLLGTGVYSQIRAGVLYEVVQTPGTMIQVKRSEADGSVGYVIQGDPQAAVPGAILKQVYDLNPVHEKALAVAASDSVPNAVESVQLKDENISTPPQLKNLVPNVSRVYAFFKSLVEAVFLPYRIYRYFAYNQPYYSSPDWGVQSPGAEPWVKQIGLDRVPEMREGSSVVAVIDSGIDYNHPWVHRSLWLNPEPWKDPIGVMDRYGWDFISNDSRPYDDAYHGTQIASLIARVAPKAKIMPLKVFNPWGITTSAAIYSAFVYAVDHGAKVIVCGWTTSVKSRALEMGIAYAKEKGVVVVAAAGDYGWNLDFYPTYPANWARTYDNVVTVAGVDSQDRLVQVANRKSNYHREVVAITAPGQGLWVAQPRADRAQETSTGLAAAIVAGALAREVSANPTAVSEQEWIRGVLDDSESIKSLESSAYRGRRVHLRR